jgi:hypothetical protein
LAHEEVMPAIEDAFKSDGVSPAAAFQLFSEWNYFTGYRARLAKDFDVASYPSASSYPMAGIEGAGGLSTSGVTFSGVALSLTEHFFQVNDGPDTVGLAVSNVNFAAAVSADTTEFPFSVGISKGGSNCVRQLSAGYCLFFDVPNFTNWSLVPFVSGQALVAAQDLVFPQPFNPVLEELKIPYPFAATNSASLWIYDISGDLIDRIAGDVRLVHYLRGSYFVWDGETAEGKKVGSGIYIYVVSDGSKSVTGKIAVVRSR